MTVSAVILTMGDRPSLLHSAIESVRAQSGCDIEVVVVGNGVDPEVEGVTTVVLDENLGVPEGRNRGVEVATGDLILFLDDDAALAEASVCKAGEALFVSDSRLGVVSMAIVDPLDGSVQRRHVPRLGFSRQREAGEVTTFLGGASFVRAEAFRQLGGFWGELFYAHEETDLSWRALDAGWRLRYQPELVVHHPATTPARHLMADRFSMRNRVLVARRNLPLPLRYVYPTVWLTISLFRARSRKQARALIDGFKEGLSSEVDRRPIGWRTIWLMTRLGRPPLI